MLQYSNPKTKKELATNLVYLIKENEKMKDFQAFTLRNGSLETLNTCSVRYTFLEKILPELNKLFNELWIRCQLKENEIEIKRLEIDLKNQL